MSRKFVLENYKVGKIYDFGDTVFEDAVTTSIVLVASKEVSKKYDIEVTFKNKVITISKKDVIANDYVFAITVNPEKLKLINKLRSNSIPLGSICKEMIFGVVITNNKDQVVSSKPRKGWKPFLEGKEIGAYFIETVSHYLNYKPQLLHRARTKEIFESKEKILLQRITGGKRPLTAAYDDQKLYNKESINNIILDEESGYSTKFVLAIINSKLINWYYVSQFTNESNLTVNLSKTYLAKLPIKEPSKSELRTIEKLIYQILARKKKNPGSNTNALEGEVDQLVYQLYGLTEEEINIVKG